MSGFRALISISQHHLPAGQIYPFTLIVIIITMMDIIFVTSVSIAVPLRHNSSLIHFTSLCLSTDGDLGHRFTFSQSRAINKSSCNRNHAMGTLQDTLSDGYTCTVSTVSSYLYESRIRYAAILGLPIQSLFLLQRLLVRGSGIRSILYHRKYGPVTV